LKLKETLTTKINLYLDRLDPELSAVRTIARTFLKERCSIEPDGTVRNFHKHDLGAENFAIVLFPAADAQWLRNPENRYIPDSYRSILASINGLFVFDFRLFGLTPSMQRPSPRLDRSKLQCPDLGLANIDWIRQFQLAEQLFYFGGRTISFEENVGYFLLENGRIQSIRRSGEVLKEWPDFPEFLNEELSSALRFANPSIAS